MSFLDNSLAFPAPLEPKPVAELTAGWGEHSAEPLVSICCATYNHVNTIEDALKGFLAQETTFPFEIIVRDDASSDGTSEIVSSYASIYPRIIRSVINETNRYQYGERPSHIWPTLIRGKYVALCEGDDFWISPTKLQKQVDLLESNPTAVMAVALTHVFEQTSERNGFVNTTKPTKSILLSSDDIHKNYYHTSTYVIRANIYKAVTERYFFGHTLFGDTALRAILISIGPFVLLPEVVSVYRITGTGIWSSLDNEAKILWEYKCASRLSRVLPGFHARFQRDRLFGLSRALMTSLIRRRDFVQATRWAFLCIWFGILKTLGYVSRRIGKLINTPTSSHST